MHKQPVGPVKNCQTAKFGS